MVKNPPAPADHIRDEGSIPESGRYSGRGHETHSSILAWRIPIDKETGRLQFMGSQRVRHDRRDLPHMHTETYGGVEQCHE